MTDEKKKEENTWKEVDVGTFHKTDEVLAGQVSLLGTAADPDTEDKFQLGISSHGEMIVIYKQQAFKIDWTDVVSIAIARGLKTTQAAKPKGEDERPERRFDLPDA